MVKESIIMKVAINMKVNLRMIDMKEKGYFGIKIVKGMKEILERINMMAKGCSTI